MMKRPSILFYSQDIPFFSEENLSELVCANDNINGIHTEPSSHSDTDSETDSEYGSDDEDSSNLNNLVNIRNDRRQMSNNSNEENTEELISLFKKQLLKHSEEHFSEAKVTEVTFESAKVYCAQLGKIENFKFHLQSCNIGSGSTAIRWKREDTRVSKHVFTATFSFSKATQHIVLENRKSIKGMDESKYKIVIPFRSFLGLFVNKATKTVAGHLSFGPKHFEQDPTAVNKDWTLVPLALQDEQEAESRAIKVSITALDNQLFDQVSSTMKKNEFLRLAMTGGIKMDTMAYVREPHHASEWCSPEMVIRQFPILYDPVICRAAQLAVLDLLEKVKSKKDSDKESNMIWLVRMFRGLNDKFVDLITTRQQRES